MSFILGRKLNVRKWVHMTEGSYYNRCKYDVYNTIIKYPPAVIFYSDLLKVDSLHDGFL